MNPTFEDKSRGVQLYLGDCLEILPSLSGIDAVVTDPPYGIGYDRNIKHRGEVANSKIIGDNLPFDPKPWLRFDRILLWGANCYASRLPDNPPWICWQKTLTDGQDGQTADFELAWCRGIERSRRITHLWAGCYRQTESGEPTLHPTQKPVAIMAWCMNLMKIETSETVLDPYMGSGTTGIACLRTGRKFIGIEIDPKYYAIAQDRIKRELAQGVLL